MELVAVVAVLVASCISVYAQGPPLPVDHNVTGTNFLDHDKPIQDFLGQTFLKDNIPYIDIPDSNIQGVYYYRWSSLQRHLRYTTAGTGYVISEFVQPVDYAKAFGTINAAAGHQIEEAQWLRSTFYDHDYVQFWTRGPGSSTQYTHWILEAAASAANVTGELGFYQTQLQGMIRMWHEWDYTFDSNAGLYYYTPVFDAQEYSLPGYVATNGVDTADGLEYDGPNTYRPSHNAYMVANARAIADAASMTGNSSVASEFNEYADNLEKAIYTHLWDPAQNFFVDVIRPNNSDLNPIQGREEVGFFPFRFGIGLESTYSNPAIQQLFDSEGFFTEYGPPTLEVRNKYFTADKPTDYCCYWQGQSWPYSTAHTLKSLAEVYRSGSSNVTAEQYYQLLSIYATTQHKDGVPYVAESHYPEKDSWSADTFNHSEHYMHSTNNHNVITGLLGFVPRADDTVEISPIIPSNWTYFAIENVPYHGHLITVLYDKDGSRYNKGSGLSIFCDGETIYSGEGTSGKAQLPGNDAQQPTSESPAPQSVNVNVAANPNGLGYWPLASATYTFEADDPYKAIDGFLFYDFEPDNRWTNYKSPNTNDTLTIQLARPQNLTGVVLAIYADNVQANKGSIACPAAVKVTDGSGETLADLSDFASQCLPNDKNTIEFDNEVQTDAVNINFIPQQNFSVGVCEVEMWVPANTGPFYYAADALPQSSTTVEFDSTSQQTPNGAVLAPHNSTSEIDFSGVYSVDGGDVTLRLSYKNNGTSTVSLGVEVNQIAAGNVTLQQTQGSGYQGATLDGVQFLKGTNFVTIFGGGDGVFIDGFGVL